MAVGLTVREVDPLDFFSLSPRNLKWKIQQGVIDNDDWKADEFFEKLGAYTCSDKRFLLLLEGLTSSEVRPDVEQQNKFAEVLNGALKSYQIELRRPAQLTAIPFLLTPSDSNARRDFPFRLWGLLWVP